MAAAAFLVGVLAGGGPSSELDAARQFAEAWEALDYETMHAELEPASARKYPLDRFDKHYARAAETATLSGVEAGEATESGDADGGKRLTIPVTARTDAFGPVSGTLELAVKERRIAWAPNLVFPGLEPGEKLDRRTRAPKRAPIRAADGTPLARGPAGARSSPLGSAALDVVGEMGAPERPRLGELRSDGFPPGTLVGTSGLEEAFDDRLAGTPGGQLVATTDGGEERVLASSDPQPGGAVRTTIDTDLQETTVGALEGRFGGIAVLDAKDGSVKALAGLAFSSPQPPGSVFKIITTVAALEAGSVTLDETFEVATEAVVGGRAISNAGGDPCGGTFVRSFADSCNSVFAPLGAKIGAEKLLSAAEDFGFNAPPQLFGPDGTAALDPPESSIPDPIGSELEVAVTAIGQGEVLATPLQMASAAQTIAAGGRRSPTPIVTEGELGPPDETVKVTEPETAETVRDLMIENVQSGTGTAAGIPEAQVAGKTGTAELGPDPDAPSPGPGESPALLENAWFVSFAPARAPRLAIAVMIVDAEGSGGEVAAPIAAQIYRAAL